jgi:Beta-lactamase
MGTVLVARGADVLLNKGYGSANLDWDLPNTPDVKFRLGSLTKQFGHSNVSTTRLYDRRKTRSEDSPTFPVKY